MTTTIVTSNLIGTSAQHTFTADDDGLYIAAGAIVGTTNNVGPLAGLSFNNLQLYVAGTLITGSFINFTGADAQVVIAAGGELSSLETNSGLQLLRFQGGSGTLVNYGTISGPNRPGVVADGNASIYNYGAINASTPVFMGTFGDAGSRLVNGGSISANDFDDATQGVRFNNGVMTEGLNTLISNLATGTISAISSEGAGVRFHATAGGSLLSNFGEITSLQDYGVNLGSVSSGQSLIRVSNWGTISGGDGAYLGSQNADSLVNRGSLVGDVLLGDGADFFDNRGGAVEGTVFGDAGQDIFRGNADEAETFNGGADADTLDFRFGAAVTVALDGSFDNAGAALGDVYAAFERVNGSAEADVIRGNGTGNTLTGGSGDDTIDGAAGADVIRGGTGVDLVTGGLGNDFFRFTSASEFGDVITDFLNIGGNNDRFQIAASVGGGLAAGLLAASQFQSRADNQAQDADDRFIFRTTDATLWFDADGNGAGAAVLVADLQAGATLTAADIQII